MTAKPDTKAPDSPSQPRSAGTVGPRYVAGEVIAEKYRLAEPLGEGGMGSVWVARNLALDVPVAIKLIRSDVDAPSAAERLLTEARAAARLKHPSIVRVFDFGRTRRGDPFIVMEFLQGETLGDRIEREGKIAATYAVQLLLPIADALASAHAKRVIHRDLKPDNIFLAESEGRLQPKVVDFGIAKFEIQSHDYSPKLTQAGTVLGSPEYLSPEQARGLENIDQRADVWAFAVVLYETITGSVPFKHQSYNALLRRIIEDPVPSILDYGAGDPELWSILLRGFEKDRERRWQSMREFGEALALWLFSHGVTEDVYGQSLRAAWLDGSSVAPEGRMSTPFFAPPALPALSSLRAPATPSLDPAPLAEPASPARGARTRATTLALVVAALLLAAGGLFGRWLLVSRLTRADSPEPKPVRGAADSSSEAAPVQPVASQPERLAPEAAQVETHSAPRQQPPPPSPNRARASRRRARPEPAPRVPRQLAPKPRTGKTAMPAPSSTASTPARAPATPAPPTQPKGPSEDDLGF